MMADFRKPGMAYMSKVQHDDKEGHVTIDESGGHGPQKVYLRLLRRAVQAPVL